MARSLGLIGRDHELAHIKRKLVDAQHDVVTIWGPAGIGKTSVARALVLDTSAAFAGGAFFCPLAAAVSTRDMLSIVADVLSLEGSDIRNDADATMRIGRALAARGNVLFVLDNVEQAIDAAATLLSAWTLAAPKARFVVTSRELLAMPGELAFELEPLGVEGTAPEPADAVRLLVERARATREHFGADSCILHTIAKRLDGIPLAIELAAARLEVMSAEELLSRLDDRFSLLRRDHGRSEGRQRTLRQAIEWSYFLLSPPEQRALEDLAVFSESFDLESAAFVLDSERAPDLLAALRHKSLLARAEGEPPRFRLLESIREFAAGRLGQRADEVALRHASYFAARAQDWALDVDADASREAALAIRKDNENLLAVVERFHDSHAAIDPPGVVAILAALEPVLGARGDNTKLEALLTRTIERASRAGAPPQVLAHALAMKGRALHSLGRLPDARAALDAARGGATSGALGARVLHELGMIAQAEGDLEEATALEEHALAMAERDGARREQGHALAALALIRHVANDFVEARQRYQDALAIHREVGDVRAEIRTRARLGFLLHDLDDGESAIHEYTQALGLQAEHRGATDEGILTGYIGNAHRDAGRIEEAVTAYDLAIARLRACGDRRYETTFTMDRGIARVLAARYAEALPDLERAATTARELGFAMLAALASGYIVVARAMLGDVEDARAALSLAREAAGTTPALVELVELHAIHVQLAEDTARGMRDGPSAREAHALVRAVREKQHHGQHLRIATRLLARAVERAYPPASALVLTSTCLRLPTGATLDCTKAPLSAVLPLLVQRRIEAPGVPVPVADLVRAGWPGERLVPRAGANRIRVLVSGLRARGLRSVLLGKEGGYYFDPQIPIVRE